MSHIYETAFTKEEVELIHHTKESDKLHRPIKVLQAMLWGVECKISGTRYRLAESDKEGYVFISIQGEDEHILGHPELTLLGFSEMINNRMSDEEYNEMVNQLAFSKVLSVRL